MRCHRPNDHRHRLLAVVRMTTHPAGPAATLATLTEIAARRPFAGFTDDDADEPETEWRTDYEEAALDRGARWHYPDGGVA